MLVDVRNLSVSFATRDGTVRAVDRVSFKMSEGETLAVVGESGSGKSVMCLSLMGLVPGAERSGEVFFEGSELLNLPKKALQDLRGRRISMIFQDPLSSLNPYRRVGWQIAEAILVHESRSKTAIRKRVLELLGLVGIPQPARRIDDYPHQLSGGMRQRVMIALSLSLDPALLIADEPTTALDVTVQAEIMELLMRLRDELGMALLLVTHDLALVAGVADRILVMYAGRIIEMGDRRTLYYAPEHPYTWGLLGSVVSTASVRKQRLPSIAGQPPSLIHVPRGCAFHPRCGYVMEACRNDVPELRSDAGRDREAMAEHVTACHLSHEQRTQLWKKAH